jgi:formamidopyrimidine-DNA glycosylase
MPELPEVEIITRGLKREILGQRLVDAKLYCVKLRQMIPEGLVSYLEAARVLQVKRIAKYILIELDNSLTLVIHLGMSGTLVLYAATRSARLKHDHLLVALEDGRELVFNDPRRFGLLDLVKTAEIIDYKLFQDLGPEPFGLEFNCAYLQSKLQVKTVPIKQAITDNHIVVGVGNIYASESLFDAKISPLRRSCDISEGEVGVLIASIRKILNRAIEAGGSSLSDYVDSYGKLGSYQEQWRVYGREKQPCVECGALVTKIKQGGRSSFYCFICQV